MCSTTVQPTAVIPCSIVERQQAIEKVAEKAKRRTIKLASLVKTLDDGPARYAAQARLVIAVAGRRAAMELVESIHRLSEDCCA